ncbi:MAG: hypothetical protein FWH14_08390 [Oscillospiraceae bacterium]|nr:hypothetical protein [Oscillospiraceae bacterium]
MKTAEEFANQLHNGTREFFLRMNEILEREGLIIRYGGKRITNRITYFPDTNRKQPLELKKQQPLVLRYTVNDNGLMVELKLNFIHCYTDIIEKMPEHIKNMFRTIRRCHSESETCDRPWVDGLPVWIDGSPNCGLKRTYTLNGEHYYLCSWNYYFNPDISNPDDVEHYAEIIKAEVAAAKARKKHNTSHYNEQGQEISREKTNMSLTTISEFSREMNIINIKHPKTPRRIV